MNRATTEKSARDLRVGDEIYINAASSFLVEDMKPSPLTGWGAPVLIGKYLGKRTGEGRIDLGANPRITDHTFTVFVK